MENILKINLDDYLTTDEIKNVIRKDLSARLPYQVKVSVNGGKEPWTLKGIFEGEHTGMMLILEPSFPSKDVSPQTSNWHLSQCKPYLRPMSSMTEKEREEYKKTLEIEYQDVLPGPIYHKTLDSYYYLLEHHFDFRGLIPAGCAIEVTEENNPYKD